MRDGTAGHADAVNPGPSGATSVHNDGTASDLPDAEARLRAIVALAADAIISVDHRNRITLFNHAAERMFGYTPAEVLGQPLDLLLPESIRSRHLDHLAAFERSPVDARRMGERDQVRGRRRTGELFPAEASISKIRLGDGVHFTAILRDITEQRQAEREREELLRREMAAREAAEASDRRFAFLADATAILHSSLDFERTFEALLRLIVPELALFATIDVVEDAGSIRRMHVVHGDPVMQPLADELRAYPRDQVRYLTRHAIATGQAEVADHVTDEMLAAAAEDETHFRLLRALAPTSYMVVPLRARERVIGAMLLARGAEGRPYDDADLELASELAERAASALDNARLYDEAQRALRARDEVLGVVSHDLRNPLAVISMCLSSILSEESPDAAGRQEAMRTMHEALAWAQRLIRDLLDVAAIEAGGLSLTRRLEDPVILVVREVHLLQPLAQQRSIALRTELPDRLPRLEVDADRIMQVLGNLIGNALKFTPAGGTVRVGASEEKDGVRFFVSDSGPGIPPDDVARVFDRFWTSPRPSSRTRGTGMGLAIVRGIVEAHGGRVRVAASSRDGTTLEFVIPFPRVSGT